MSKIDVNKCEHIWISSNKKECLAYQDFCVNRPDCYYRQLQRKEQECEELKDKNNAIHSIADDLQQRNHNLTLKNEELKKQYNCYACGNCNGKEDYINLEKHHIGLRKQYDKYSQCLDEIEEIVTKYRVADSNLFMSMDIPNVVEIFKIIKQAKEGEE